MLLVVDIGNTNITLGVYDNSNLLETFRLASDKELSAEEYGLMFKTILSEFDITECIIASVVIELNKIIKEVLDAAFNLDSIFLTSNLNLPIKLKLTNPNEVGADRIANASGAYKLYSKALIVVDMGTATTFEVVNNAGEFVGGAIMPGVNMQFFALNNNTSKLPKIDFDSVEKVIGNNTNDAILSGVIRGSDYAIEVLINQLEFELNERVITIGTGGFCNIIGRYMNRKFDYINPNLTLEGLKIIKDMNN